MLRLAPNAAGLKPQKTHRLPQLRSTCRANTCWPTRTAARRIRSVSRSDQAPPAAWRVIWSLRLASSAELSSSSWPSRVSSPPCSNSRKSCRRPGAYGTDSDIRADLVDVARQRATGRTGQLFGPDSTVLIGDTPADVAAARDGAARIITVATGRHTIADLAAAGASTALADLTDTTVLIAGLYPDKHP
jgi:hypothetical protein